MSRRATTGYPPASQMNVIAITEDVQVPVWYADRVFTIWPLALLTDDVARCSATIRNRELACEYHVGALLLVP